MNQAQIPIAAFTERLLRLREVSDFLQISPSSVYRMVEERKIPFLRVGGAIRFKPRSILEWTERQQRAVLGKPVEPGAVADVVFLQTESRRRSQ
jgi:excisionase family DNA binding protein